MTEPIDHPAVAAAIDEVATQFGFAHQKAWTTKQVRKILAPALVHLVADEREACTKVANEVSHADASAEWGSGFARAADDITVAIRARGTP